MSRQSKCRHKRSAVRCQTGAKPLCRVPRKTRLRGWMDVCSRNVRPNWLLQRLCLQRVGAPFGGTRQFCRTNHKDGICAYMVSKYFRARQLFSTGRGAGPGKPRIQGTGAPCHRDRCLRQSSVSQWDSDFLFEYCGITRPVMTETGSELAPGDGPRFAPGALGGKGAEASTRQASLLLGESRTANRSSRRPGDCQWAFRVGYSSLSSKGGRQFGDRARAESSACHASTHSGADQASRIARTRSPTVSLACVRS